MPCLTVDDVVLVDEHGLLHVDLAGHYEDYLSYKRALGDDELPKSPREWIPYARGEARRQLARLLGDNLERITLRRTAPVLINIAATPRPVALTDERLAELLEFFGREANRAKTSRRMSGGPSCRRTTSASPTRTSNSRPATGSSVGLSAPAADSAVTLSA